MNPVKERIFTLIRERYIELRKEGKSVKEAIELVTADRVVNALQYSPSYIRDIVNRVDPVRAYRYTAKKKVGFSR